MPLNTHYFLFFIAMLTGFALILLPVAGTFFAGLGTFLEVIGIVIVLIFAIAIIWRAVQAFSRG